MDYLTSRQVAAMHGVDDSTVRRWIRAGHLPAQRLGRTWMIRENDARIFRPQPDGNPAIATVAKKFRWKSS